METKLSYKTLKKSIDLLNDNRQQSLFWVDNKLFYKSILCKAMFGRIITDEEINKAKKDDRGYITKLRGVELYLSKKLKTKSL